MKAKRSLLLIPFVLLVSVLLLGLTGLAAAAPATAVKGTDVPTYMFLNYDGYSVDPVSGDWVMPGNVEEWWLSGDLEGVCHEELTYYGNIKSSVHWCEGLVTFTGTLKGDAISWSARVYGMTKNYANSSFAARANAKYTLFSGMQGQITFHAVLSEDGFSSFYTGELK